MHPINAFFSSLPSWFVIEQIKSLQCISIMVVVSYMTYNIHLVHNKYHYSKCIKVLLHTYAESVANIKTETQILRECML